MNDINAWVKVFRYRFYNFLIGSLLLLNCLWKAVEYVFDIINSFSSFSILIPMYIRPT